MKISHAVPLCLAAAIASLGMRAAAGPAPVAAASLSAPARSPSTPPRAGDQAVVLPLSADVRIRARPFGRGWRAGTVGTVGPCTVILVPNAWDGRRITGYKPVPIDSLLAIEIVARRINPAAQRFAPRPAGWRPLSLAQVRRAHGGCTAW
ncbi:hypothetical protein [Longimicrobium terrae]|uniref:Uncharacterized protein n=1 Tax=Longimicrobium terrae TaxID=1639882 RepID=A0A841GNG8_9BACT|nr:hypothetical protein [Longimicrobium terrae]MBB4634680.1 hypothetical protein [Longimicrobium terrae]MBB6068430.1 hypothetical protein [Longimicrobium terrae]NNC32711.1 hypothetical protein [Longimicrobium terrae]